MDKGKKLRVCFDAYQDQMYHTICMHINDLLKAIWLTIHHRRHQYKTNRNYKIYAAGKAVISNNGAEGGEKEQKPQQDEDLKHD